MTSTGIVASDVTRSFGPVQALRDVSLAVEEGQIVAVLGAMTPPPVGFDSVTVNVSGLSPVASLRIGISIVLQQQQYAQRRPGLPG